MTTPQLGTGAVESPAQPPAPVPSQSDTPIYDAVLAWFQRGGHQPVWPVDDPPDDEPTVTGFPLPECCPYWPDVEHDHTDRSLFRGPVVAA